MGENKEKKPHRVSVWIAVVALEISLIVHQAVENKNHQEIFEHHQQVIEYKQQILDQEKRIYNLLWQILEQQQSVQEGK